MDEDKKLTESKILNEDEMTGIGGGLIPGSATSPVHDGCWFSPIYGAEFKDGCMRIKCREADRLTAGCKKQRSNSNGIKSWYSCKCWGTYGCIGTWHRVDGCAEK